MHMEKESINYSPGGRFGQYIEVLFDDDDLWNNFLYYVRQAEPNRDDDFLPIIGNRSAQKSGVLCWKTWAVVGRCGYLPPRISSS